MPLNSPRASKGFSLIEVLIALVILAIGLLGMASLMLTSMQSNQNAAERSAAIVLSYDLIERMRSNPDQVDLYVGDPSTSVDPCIADDCTAGMTSTQLAGNDLANWASELGTNIPGSAAVIQQLASNEYCVAIFWPQNQAAMVPAGTTACGTAAAGRAFTTLQVTL